MCLWFLDHGRCGEDFPKSKNEFLFISDDFVTHPSSKSQKEECKNRRPSPREVQPDMVYGDDYSSSDY